MEEEILKLSADIRSLLKAGSVNIFGLPYSGKDTHGAELKSLIGGDVIGGGDIIRNSTAENIKSVIATGALAPIDEYLAMVVPFFSQDTLKDIPLILSSVGRWDGEQQAIVEAAKTTGHEIKAVIYLKISRDESIRRWKIADRGRHDDKDLDILQKRFEEFESKTIPVIEYYRQLGLLIEIDSMPAPIYVTIRIIKALQEKLLLSLQ